MITINIKALKKLPYFMTGKRMPQLKELHYLKKNEKKKNIKNTACEYQARLKGLMNKPTSLLHSILVTFVRYVILNKLFPRKIETMLENNIETTT